MICCRPTSYGQDPFESKLTAARYEIENRYLILLPQGDKPWRLCEALDDIVEDAADWDNEKEYPSLEALLLDILKMETGGMFDTVEAIAAEKEQEPDWAMTKMAGTGSSALFQLQLEHRDRCNREFLRPAQVAFQNAVNGLHLVPGDRGDLRDRPRRILRASSRRCRGCHGNAGRIPYRRRWTGADPGRQEGVMPSLGETARSVRTATRRDQDALIWHRLAAIPPRSVA